MSSAAVDQILFRSAVAAVNNNDRLRVYTQDVQGNIRESLYENRWSNGTIKNVIAQARYASPLAATNFDKKLDEIRVYYIAPGDKLQEICYSSGKGWYAGDLNKSNVVVAPYSKISANYLDGKDKVIRVYIQQPDNTIQEWGIDNDSKGWHKETNLGAALPGTEIASTTYVAGRFGIRTYFQNQDRNLIEKAYDEGKGWYNGGFSVPNAITRTPVAATSFNASANGVSIRVYYSAQNDRVLEKGYDGSKGWYDGGFNQPSIPASQVAAINWGSGSGLNLRVYFQNGTDVSGVSEWVYNGNWTKGVPAIPPAQN